MLYANFIAPSLEIGNVRVPFNLAYSPEKLDELTLKFGISILLFIIFKSELFYPHRTTRRSLQKRLLCGRAGYFSGQPPCSSITSSISPMTRMVSCKATTMRW